MGWSDGTWSGWSPGWVFKAGVMQTEQLEVLEDAPAASVIRTPAPSAASRWHAGLLLVLVSVSAAAPALSAAVHRL